MQKAGQSGGQVKRKKMFCRWKVLGRGQNHEALVYLHGFNCGLMDACKGLAQFLALANLPPHVGPFFRFLILLSWVHAYITLEHEAVLCHFRSSVSAAAGCHTAICPPKTESLWNAGTIPGPGQPATPRTPFLVFI